MFNEGISKIGEILDLGVEKNVVEKSGAWYTYKGERIGQGREQSKTFLRGNPAISKEIEDRVREAAIVARKAAAAGKTAPPAKTAQPARGQQPTA
jgi:recombination protein RecA